MVRKIKVLARSLTISLVGLLLFAPIAHAAAPYPASTVLGQSNGSTPDFTTDHYNNISAPNSYGLSAPTAVVVDTVAHLLFVSDTSNSRILVHELDSSNNIIDRQADNVLGQPDFVSDTSAATQNGMSSPSGLAVDVNNSLLFVSDINYNRVLVYDYASLTNGENAVAVLGQSNFTNSAQGLTQSGMDAPASLTFDDSTDRLFVGERDNQRVLVFDASTITDGENAINVLGAPDFTTGGTALNAVDMGNVAGLAIDSVGQRLFATDYTNHRVLVFDVASIADGESAVNVLGAPDLTTSGSISTTDWSLWWPDGLSFDSSGNRLFVSSRSKSRVMIFDTSSISNGESAVNVLGQTDFSSSLPDANPTHKQMRIEEPRGSTYAAGRLYVVDQGLHRLMVFDAPTITNSEDAMDEFGTTTENGGANFDSNGDSPIIDNQHANSRGLNEPTQLVIDQELHRLFIADYVNCRIIVHNLNSSNQLVDNQADAYLGQQDASGSFCGQSASLMAYPTAVTLDPSRHYLFVGDSNNRVLVFDVNNVASGENAINVLGISTFDDGSGGALTQSSFITSRGLTFDDARNYLFVADSQNNRILVYDATSITNGMNAIFVIGQSDFTSAVSGLTQTSMFEPTSLVFDSTNDNLFVSDTNNGRIMVFDTTTLSNGMNAANVIDEADFTSATSSPVDAGMIDEPGGLAIDITNRILFVQDYQANRILAFDISSISNDESAVAQLGQLDFATVDPLSPSTTSTSGEWGLYFDDSTQTLYSSDNVFSRVTVFELIRITTTSLPVATDTLAYSQNVNHEQSEGTVNFSLASGTLPTGLSLSGGGTISGTPTQTGTFNITVEATDDNGGAGTFVDRQSLNLTVVSNDVDGDSQVNSVDTDDDGDNIDDTEENSAPNSGDGNADEIPDNYQTEVTSMVNDVTGEYITLDTTDSASTCDIANFEVNDESSLAAEDPNADYPVGLNNFTVNCATPGDTAQINIIYDQEYDTSSWVYKKYNPVTEEYTDITGQVTFGATDVGGQTVTTVSYSVTDGDSLDQDGSVNGTIVDPAGPAVLADVSLEDTGDAAMYSVITGGFIMLSAIVLSNLDVTRKKYVYRGA